MRKFKMTIYTTNNQSFNVNVEANTPDEALDKLWKVKNDDWIRINTNMSLTEYIQANKVVKVDVIDVEKEKIEEDEEKRINAINRKLQLGVSQ